MIIFFKYKKKENNNRFLYKILIKVRIKIDKNNSWENYEIIDNQKYEVLFGGQALTT